MSSQFCLSIVGENGQEEILYEPTPKQLEFHSRIEPNVLLWGNRGGGKSVALRWEAHTRALAHPGFHYCILRKTYPELEKSHLIFIQGEMKKLGGYYNQTQKKAYYPNGSIGFFSHCSGEEDVLNLLSSQFGWMGFDELSTFDWDHFTRLATSVRVTKDSGLTAMVRACTNPLGPSAEDIMHYFVDKDVDPEDDADYNPADWAAVKIGMEDNIHIDKEQYVKRFSGLASHVRKAWLDGEFILENALFDVRKCHFVESVPRLDEVLKGAQIYRTYDHGYYPDPAICLWIAHFGNKFLVFHEKLWYKKVAAEIADEIKEETREMGIDRTVITYCDPTIDLNTGADIRTIKDIIEDKGVPLECSVNSRELYAASIHAALAAESAPGEPKLQIYTRGAPYLAKTLPKQRYDPKHPLRMANTKTDHAAVALAYFLISSGAMDRIAIGDPTAAQSRRWMKPKNTERWVLGRNNVRDN
jgi:phage terminase large subunit